MVRLHLALAILLAVHGGHHPSFVQSFQPNSILSIPSAISHSSQHHTTAQLPQGCRRTVAYYTSDVQRTGRTVRHVAMTPSSSSAGSDNNGSSSDVLGEALSSVTNAAVDSISQAVRDEPDADEDDVARKQKLMSNRVQTYKVTLPLASGPAKSKSIVLSLGISLCQINKGRTLETSRELNLDTLEVEDHLATSSRTSNNNNNNNGGSPSPVVIQRMDTTSIRRRIDGEFQGVVVSAVVEGSAGWIAGVRPGDILKTSSATLGTNLWPKSTLDGVKSALLSRKAVAESVQFEFQRLGEAVDNQFELTLTRPIGLELKETQDGYVVVTGFTPKASTLVKYAVKVGDRVLAVDSNLGDRMWPVSTVDGVISAVTSRLPGQQITFRFERYGAIAEAEFATSPSSQAVLGANRGTTSPMSVTLPDTASKVDSENLLLERCREVIKRYTTGEKYIDKFALPGLVADKVVYALASAETRVDAVTLSMIQAAYLSCRQPEMVIQLFEAAVGLRADGSTSDVVDAVARSMKGVEENPLIGKDGKRLVPNLDALDGYTASALLKAYAMMGDLSSVQRVLAALEGRSGTVVDNLEVAAWPGTGPRGSLQPDTQCYNMVISAAADSGTNDGLALALEIFDKLNDPSTFTKLSMDSIHPFVPQKDIVSYNTVIKALTNNGRYQKAIETFYQMKKVGVRPDKYSYTSLVKAVMVDSDIEELLYDMREEGVDPDVKTFNTIIRDLCEQKKISAARRIVNIMDTSGVAPDSWTYGYLMKGLLDSGNPSAALTLFETACSDRRTVGATENVYLYTTAMSAAAAVGDHSRALELLSRMKRIGIKPNVKTLTALLGACLAAQKPELAVDVFRRIPDPDTFAVTQGLIAMARAGQSDDVLTMLSDRDSMPGKLRGTGLMKVYETLFKASIGAGNYTAARKVTNSLLRGGNIPSKALFQTIIETMGVLPAKGVLTGLALSSDGVNEEDSEKFMFLLFLLDSISGRKLPCETPLYSAVLSFGLYLGGLPKKIASLIVSAKAYSGVFAKRTKLIDEEQGEDTSVAKGWEDLFMRYDDLKSQIGDPSTLPLLEVRVSSREVVKVLRAEKNLSYSTQTRNSKR